jgi:hypothetical protein
MRRVFGGGGGSHIVSRSALWLCSVAVLALLAGCAAPPPPQGSAGQKPQSDPACQAGGDARGIATGFFALFQDRPECF